jgi:peroxiredoxin Q/BCP
MIKLQKGDTAPEFDLPDQTGKGVRLGDFRGKKVLVYFYPKADTPGCTKQACSVKEAEPELGMAGVVAIGISPDKPEKQKKFDDKYELGFILLSDVDHKVAESYGVWGEKKMYGKTYEGIVRSSFLLNEDGVVIGAWYKVSPADTVPNARKALNDAV